MFWNALNKINFGSKNFVKLLVRYKYVILPYLIAIPMVYFLGKSDNGANDYEEDNSNDTTTVNNTNIENKREFVLFILDDFNKGTGMFKKINSIQIGGGVDTNSLITQLDISVPFKFNLYEYRLPPDFVASESFKEIRNLGSKVSESLNKRYRKLLSNTINNSSIKYEDGGFDINYFVDINAILLLIKVLKANLNDNLTTTIYVKGYADGSKFEGWSKPLEPNHKYDIIKYLPKRKDRLEADFDFFYDEKEVSEVLSNGRYSNENLPNLRAKYIAEELIKPQLELHNLTRPNAKDLVEVKILEGKVIDRVVDTEDLRFVDIYIKFDW